MTENELRAHYVDTARSYLGAGNGNAKHRELLDLYNSIKPLPRGAKMTTSMPWCSATVSAVAVKAEMADIIPLECSCNCLIDKAKEMDIWVEDDRYRPRMGDVLLYDWDDDRNCAGDNKNQADHVGIVERITGNEIKVIEGNMRGNIMGIRTMTVNGRFIRGYICPDYASKATPAPHPAAMGEYVVQKGDTLSGIAKRFLHDPMRYKELAEINGIKNPDIIHPGQKLLIPADLGFEPGDKVRVRSGAPVYGKSYKFHGWVYDKPLFVRKVDGNCVTITTDLNQTANTGKVDAKYLIHA